MSILQQPKVGLALGGGSTYGFAHIGVLRALVEHGIPIDCIAGTSAGAIVGACHAFGMRPDQIITAAKELSWRKVTDFSFSKMGLASNKSLATYVASSIGTVRIEDAPIPLAIIATNIETREKVVLRRGSLGLALRASTSVPGLFVPVEVDGSLLVDGGLSDNVPLLALKELGATILIGVNLQAHNPTYRPKNIIEVLDIATMTLTKHRDVHLADHSDVLIEPDLSAFNSNRFRDIDGMIEAGYRATIAQLPAIQANIAAQTRVSSRWQKFLAVLNKKLF